MRPIALVFAATAALGLAAQGTPTAFNSRGRLPDFSPSSVIIGAVPDRLSAGTPLTLRKNGATPAHLDMSWGDSCGPDQNDFAVYEGTLGSWYSHSAMLCSTAGAFSKADLLPAPGNRYYLIVPLATGDEGSYGSDSAGGQIPPGLSPCRATRITATCVNADLAISKTDGIPILTGGETVTYTIGVSNAGPNGADGAVFTDPAAANLAVTGVTCGPATGGAACGVTSVALMQGSGVVIPLLPVGGGVSFTVTATAGTSGAVSNTAAITPPSGIIDPNPADNSATDSDTVFGFTGGVDTPQWGNTGGGGAFNDACPSGQALTGFTGGLDATNDIGSISAQCGVVSWVASGVLPVSPGTTFPTRGTGTLSPWSALCPAGTLIIGFAGRAGLSINQLRFRCAPILASGGGTVFTIGATTDLFPVGGSGGAAFPQTDCPAGTVATVARIRSGSGVDAFGLGCSTPSPAI